MKDYPTTKEEWWLFVWQHEKELLNIISRFTPDRLEEARQYIIDKNPELANVLSDAWFFAPDSPSIHSIPGWGILCNLCSEESVLHDGEVE